MDIIRRAFVGIEYNNNYNNEDLQSKAATIFFPLLDVVSKMKKL